MKVSLILPGTPKQLSELQEALARLHAVCCVRELQKLDGTSEQKKQMLEQLIHLQKTKKSTEL